MNNGDLPAAPLDHETIKATESGFWFDFQGLTKREAFVKAIVAGSPAPVTGTGRMVVIEANRKAWALKCVREADALLKALEAGRDQI